MKKLLLPLLVFLLSTTLYGDDRFRAVFAGDVIGVWEQVAIRKGLLTDVGDPWFSNPQLFMFTEDGYVKSLIKTSNQITDKDLSVIKSAKKTTTYYFAKEMPGAFRITYTQGTSYDILGTYCNRIPRDIPEGFGEDPNQLPQVGDIILTYRDESTDEALFYRLLRKRT